MAAPIRQTLLDLVPDIKNYLVSDVDPSKVSGNNRVKYEFRCKKCGKHFIRSAGDYTRGTGLCKTCAKQSGALACSKTRGIDNSLLSWFIQNGIDIPEVIGDVDLSTTPLGSSKKKITFVCSNGHEFSITPYRISQGQWCPFCSKSKRISRPELCIYMLIRDYRRCKLEYPIPGTRQSLDIFIEDMNIGIEFDWQRYHGDLENDIAKDNTCKQLGITVLRVREPQCPEYTSENVYTLNHAVESWKDLNECRWWIVNKLKVNIPCLSFEQPWKDMYAYLYNGKVQNNAYQAYWMCKNNDELISNRRLAESMGRNEKDRKLRFKCSKCGSEYDMSPSNYIWSGCRCPYCSGKRVNETNNLGLLGSMLGYSELNPLPASDVHIHSSKKIIWRCNNGHYYEASPEHRLTGGKTGCPICSNNVILKGFNDLETWYPVMYRMIKDNAGTIAINSQQHLTFKCEECKYEFVATPLSMHKRRHYCPKWRNHKYEMRYIEQVRAYKGSDI